MTRDRAEGSACAQGSGYESNLRDTTVQVTLLAPINAAFSDPVLQVGTGAFCLCFRMCSKSVLNSCSLNMFIHDPFICRNGQAELGIIA